MADGRDPAGAGGVHRGLQLRLSGVPSQGAHTVGGAGDRGAAGRLRPLGDIRLDSQGVRLSRKQRGHGVPVPDLAAGGAVYQHGVLRGGSGGTRVGRAGGCGPGGGPVSELLRNSGLRDQHAPFQRPDRYLAQPGGVGWLYDYNSDFR